MASRLSGRRTEYRPAAARETIGRTRGPEASPGRLGDTRNGFGDVQGQLQRRQTAVARLQGGAFVGVSVSARQRDRGIVIIPLDSLSFSLSFSLSQILSLSSLFRSLFQHQNLK